jgi:hypothetical protein
MNFAKEQKSRQHLRKPASFPVIFTLPDGSRRAGICSNISLGGLRIETPEPGAFAAWVTIALDLGGPAAPITVPGIVRWTTPGSMGIQLRLLGARETYVILRILAGE